MREEKKVSRRVDKLMKIYKPAYFQYLDTMKDAMPKFNPFASYKDRDGEELNPLQLAYLCGHLRETEANELMRDLWYRYNYSQTEDNPRPPLQEVLNKKFGINDKALPHLLQTIMSYTDIVVDVVSSKQHFSSEQTLVFHLEIESGLPEADGMEDGTHVIRKDEEYYVGHSE